MASTGPEISLGYSPVGNIQSSDSFAPIAHERKYLINYNETDEVL